MTQEIDIIQLTTGTPKGSDFYPAVDVTDTTQSSTGTTKKYLLAELLDFILNAINFTVYQSVVAASTATLNATYNNGSSGVGATLTNAGAQTAFTLDGQTGVLGYRYLIKDMDNGAYNGIYNLTTVGNGSTNWVLTRSTDYNSSSNIIDGGLVFVTLGTVNANTLWVGEYTGSMTVGTTIITFTPFSINPNPEFTWNLVTGTTQSLLANNGYINTNVALTTYTLPVTSSVGDVIKIVGDGSGGWRVSQNASQTIYMGNTNTTSGVLGFLASTNAGDCIEMVCIENNNKYRVVNSMGNITVN